MSSSPRNSRQIKSTIPAGKGASQKINWWGELPAVMSCPECGKKAMRRFSGSCRLLDGTLIPKLERFHCSSCKADFFDDGAMQVIEEFRKSLQRKAPRAPRVSHAQTVLSQ